jgi:hypothetical protein
MKEVNVPDGSRGLSCRDIKKVIITLNESSSGINIVETEYDIESRN